MDIFLSMYRSRFVLFLLRLVQLTSPPPRKDDPKKDNGANGRVSVVSELGGLGGQTGPSSLKLVGSKTYSWNLTAGEAAGTEYQAVETGQYK